MGIRLAQYWWGLRALSGQNCTVTDSVCQP
jgi:hypothetical protein